MNNANPIIFMTCLVMLGACQTNSSIEKQVVSVYPDTKKVDTVDIYFDTEVADPYRWLEDDRSEETGQWVSAQNEVTFGYINNIPFRDKVKARLMEMYDYEKIYAPVKHGDYYYYYKNDGLQNQNVLYRKSSEEGEGEVFIDPNTFNEEGTISLSSTSFTKDGSLVGLLLSEGGSDWRKAVVLDAATKAVVGDTLVDLKFTGLQWNGNDGFFYSSYEKPKEGSELSAKTQYHRLFYHKLGTPQSEDKLVFGGENEPRRYIFSQVTDDNQYLVINAAESTSGNQLYIISLTDANAPILKLVDDFNNEFSVVDNVGSKFLLETDFEAPNNRVVEVDLNQPERENWKDIIPEGENVLSVNSGGGKLFASYLIDAKTAVFQFDYEGNQEREIKLPTIGTASGFYAEKEDTHLYYTFRSFTYPSTIFKYDIASGESTVYQRPEVDFDPDLYEIKQEFYTSKDGTKVPMFIVHKKGIELDGKNPTYLYAYGGFNISLRPSFSSSRLVWLENGGIYAQPSLRGGGEYGKAWHDAGTKMQKQNVFDDFIAAAEYLISEGYTSSDYLAIAGGSNGGLLVGATMTQRPDLAKVALPAVGVMDMLRYHKFTAGAGWAYDYGTSDDSKEMFDYLRRYSPVHALKPGTSYPATMVTTADHDDRVVPAHSFKFAATLQEHHVGENPVLIRIETDAGHGAGTPTSKRMDQIADQYSFAWYNMGFIPFKEDL